ncbi:hypothetical protein LCGC14_1070450 [marine sediment metagenome]|uniref:Uncharacterized protein n=1 Tax=marine sediment metagenome TaxID=412755 RepID=A0A0F9QP81_9ZZZZ
MVMEFNEAMKAANWNPMESITERIEESEDPEERKRLEKVRCIYRSDLPPVEMAKGLMELRG